MTVEEEVGSLLEGEGSGVTALGVVIMAVVAEALVETSMQTGVNSREEVGFWVGVVVEMFIIKEEGEAAVQADQSTMLLALHETFLH